MTALSPNRVSPSDSNIDGAFSVQGYTIIEGLFEGQILKRLRDAYFSVSAHCASLQRKYGNADDMRNTAHHVLFLDPAYTEALLHEAFLRPVRRFFEGHKFVLHSLGTINNDGHINHASKIHRDQRFVSHDRLKLNTIIAVSGLSPATGATEFMPGSHAINSPPTEAEFEAARVQVTCPPGSVIYFDSRLWHRAGRRTQPEGERIIVTPLFTRPFIKPGFDYTRALLTRGVEGSPEMLKQLCGYYADIPETHDQWYDVKGRKFYHGDQDV
jgi:ectoine hydroxylase-related dioxygenase (phytanoyl-CoA dioxygenase family)